MASEIGIVYIATAADPRWAIRSFLSSVEAYPPGSCGELIFAAKAAGGTRLDRTLSKHRAIDSWIECEDSPSMINTCFEAAKKLPHDYLLFLVSWSRILAPDWTTMFLTAMRGIPNVGAVGATGSFEALRQTGFPNANLRTTGFLIDRRFFLDLDGGELRARYDGNLFEAGPRSLTRQIEGHGLQALVITRTGGALPATMWATSRTFRSYGQEQLLIADNRTQEYAASRFSRRLKLARLAFGEAAAVSRPSWTEIVSARLRWRFAVGSGPVWEFT